ncbi:MAG: hypothetical protein WCG27_07205 [Pseudomonadota bacterium]
MTKFRTLDQAILLHRECRTLKLPHYLKDQRRFFEIAFGSMKELKTILELADAPLAIKEQADKTAAHLFKLIKYYSL